MAYRNYATANSRIVDPSNNGDFATITLALAAASSGQTIFIRPGTYTENLTLKAGVNLTAFMGDATTPEVIINGNCTLTGAGSLTISGIQLQTNSAPFLTVSGSAASIVNLNNCNLNCSNTTGITYSSSSASSQINISNCTGNLGTTGIAYFSHSSLGNLNINFSNFSNSGSSTTASTVSSGVLNIQNTIFLNPVTASSTGGFGILYSSISTGNTTSLTAGGSGTQTATFSSFSSGSASAITISTTLSLAGCFYTSSNTNCITGAGTINYVNPTFGGSSKTINTTTQGIAGIAFGSTTTAPTAGMIGEQITANASAIATTNSTAKTITSINLTAGIWDISGSAFAVPTGGTGLMSVCEVGISATTNTLGATAGIDFTQLNISGTTNSMGLTAPLTRVVISSSATYYLVVLNIYSSTTCPTNAKISATRVG